MEESLMWIEHCLFRSWCIILNIFQPYAKKIPAGPQSLTDDTDAAELQLDFVQLGNRWETDKGYIPLFSYFK